MFGPRTRLPLRGLIPQVHRTTEDPGQRRLNQAVQSVLRRLDTTTTQSQAETTDAAVTGTQQVYMAPFFATESSTIQVTLVNGQSRACYMGVLERDVTSVDLAYRVVTAPGSTTWTEVGVATGLVGWGSAPVLTMQGTAAGPNSVGVQRVAVAATLPAGSSVWAVLGSQHSGSFAMRVQGREDNLQCGMTALLSGTRPSTLVGPQTWTIDLARPFWWAMRA